MNASEARKKGYIVMTNTTSLPAITKGDFSLIEGQPRILDLRLAQALGFNQPRGIRKLIQRNIAALTEAGGGLIHMEQTPPSAIGGRPGLEYRLTLDQSLYLCAKSGTERAARITLDMVRVYRETHFGAEASPPAPGALGIAPEALRVLRPELRACLRYSKLGLSGVEIGRLLRRPARRVQEWRADLRAAGFFEARDAALKQTRLD